MVFTRVKATLHWFAFEMKMKKTTTTIKEHTNLEENRLLTDQVSGRRMSVRGRERERNEAG